MQAGMRSLDAFVMHRCQIVLARERGERVPQIAHWLGCDEQTVRNAVHPFNQTGLAALQPGSKRPQETHAAFNPETAEKLRALLYQTPRNFGLPTSLWTLELAAQVSCAQGLTPARVTGETIRATLARLGVKWKRTKQWIPGPGPAFERKKGRAIA